MLQILSHTEWRTREVVNPPTWNKWDYGKGIGYFVMNDLTIFINYFDRDRFQPVTDVANNNTSGVTY